MTRRQMSGSVIGILIQTEFILHDFLVYSKATKLPRTYLLTLSISCGGVEQR